MIIYYFKANEDPGGDFTWEMAHQYRQRFADCCTSYWMVPGTYDPVTLGATESMNAWYFA